MADGNKKIDDEQRQMAPAPTTLVLAARDHPRPTHIFKRGDWQKPGPLVTPGVPVHSESIAQGRAAQPPHAGPMAGRSEEADRGAGHGQSHLAGIFWARAGRHLGGFRHPGRSPHPPGNLLDWLACEFMDSGWDVKHIQRLIAESATYRQSSVVTPRVGTAIPTTKCWRAGRACGWMRKLYVTSL
jgi:hypothetical protein